MEVQEQARSAYKLFKADSSLRFKELLEGEPDWSVRVGRRYNRLVLYRHSR